MGKCYFRLYVGGKGNWKFIDNFYIFIVDVWVVGIVIGKRRECKR